MALQLKPEHAVSNKRRLQFGMKSLLAAMSLVCVLMAVLAGPLIEERRQQRLLAEVGTLGGKVSVVGSVMRDASLGRLVLGAVHSSYYSTRMYRISFAGAKLADGDLELLTRIQFVTELDLSDTLVTNDGLSHLNKLLYLRAIDLSGTAVTDKGMQSLANLERLRSVRVVGTSVTYPALENLSAKLPDAYFCEENAIEALRLAGVQVVTFPRFIEADDTIDTVRLSDEAREVIVGMNRALSLADRDVEHLSQLQSITQLTFHTVTLDASGLNSLEQLSKLKQLGIYMTNLTDADLDCLRRQTQLEELIIYGCKHLTNEGVHRLNSLTNLKKLSIRGCPAVTEEAVLKLCEQLPNCKCEFSKY
jgi:hypothetical protein